MNEPIPSSPLAALMASAASGVPTTISWRISVDRSAVAANDLAEDKIGSTSGRRCA
jgi:hypothetical protein